MFQYIHIIKNKCSNIYVEYIWRCVSACESIKNKLSIKNEVQRYKIITFNNNIPDINMKNRRKLKYVYCGERKCTEEAAVGENE